MKNNPGLTILPVQSAIHGWTGHWTHASRYPNTRYSRRWAKDTHCRKRLERQRSSKVSVYLRSLDSESFFMFRTVLRKSLGLISLRSVDFGYCGTFDKVIRTPSINKYDLERGGGSRPPVWQQGFLPSVYTACRTTNHPNRNIGGSHCCCLSEYAVYSRSRPQTTQRFENTLLWAPPIEKHFGLSRWCDE